MTIFSAAYHTCTIVCETASSRIYRATLIGSQQPIILKTLASPDLSADHQHRLRHEYAILQQLQQPGIIRALGLEYDRQQCPLLVLEDIGGTSLAALMLAGTLSTDHLLELACAITDAVVQLHAHQIVHRDLNPANIVLNPATGHLQLIDFEFALPLAEAPQVGRIIEGTLAYLAPEQTGRTSWPIGRRADLYALGCTLYELACGHPPFDGVDALALVHAHLASVPPPLPPNIPTPLAAIIAKLLAKHPDERYQSAAGLLADLREAQRQWTDIGYIAPFALGTHDRSERLVLPTRLYGREQEQAQLLAALRQVHTGASGLVLLQGEAGCGKSVLVQTLLPVAQSTNARFVSGKFDQLQRAIPYFALIQACTRLIQQLLATPEAQLSAMREHFHRMVGSNLSVLVDLLPELALLVGEQPPALPLGLQETQNRFLRTFQQFLSVLASPQHPLILFLDDLQWADGASLEIIQYLVQHAPVPGLLLLGAYRAHEVDAHHPLSPLLRGLDQAAVAVTLLTVAALQVDAVGALLADTLHQSMEMVAPLSMLLYRKTEGNPLFVRELLQTLAQNQQLWVDGQTREWCWDLPRIEREGLTDNVVLLLAQKLYHLPESVQHLLMLAAAAGNEIEAASLALLTHQPVREVEQELWEAVAAGLLVAEVKMTMELRYCFVHDRVQQAAYELLTEAERPRIHYALGRQIMEQMASPSDAMLFDAVFQLNKGRNVITSEAEREHLAQLNLTVGQRALASAAYGVALEYLEQGIAYLRSNAWAQQYLLALLLHQHAAEAALFNAQLERMEQFVSVIRQHARDDVAYSEATRLLVEGAVAQNHNLKAVAIALDLLGRLGIKLPKKPTKIHIIHELLRTMWVLRGKQPADLLELPEMTDPHAISTIKLMASVIPAVTFVQAELYPLLVFYQVRLCLQSGHTPLAGQAYAFYGMILADVVGQVDRGYAFGQAALQIADQFGSAGARPATLVAVALFLAYRKQALHEVQPLFLEVQQSALAVGDLQNGAYGAYIRSLFAWATGTHLQELEAQLQADAGFFQQIKQQAMLIGNKITRQFVLELIQPTDQPWVLCGEAFDENAELSSIVQTKNGLLLFELYHKKCLLAYIFYQYDIAHQNLVMLLKYTDSILGSHRIPMILGYESLVRLSCLSKQDTRGYWKHLLKVETNQRRLAKYAKHAPMNFLHLWHLVEGERRRAHQEWDAAQHHYQQARALSHQHGFRLEEALASERSALAYFQQCQPAKADAALRQAYDTYAAWGALAKVHHLKQQFPQLAALAPAAEPPRGALGSGSSSTSSSSRLTAEALDLASILKAGHAITREIELSSLVATLVHLACENAGADTGLLLFDHEGVWSPFLTQLDQPPPSLPESVLSYVARTCEPLVLADTAVDSAFSADPVFQARRPRSLACLPLLNQGQLSALLYLENAHIPNAFTPERIQTVNLLAAQAAIALQNATLYQQLADYSRTLEHQVAQRTRELDHARAVAEDANRLKSQFLANMSHELRTPLNAIINFTEFTIDEDYGPLSEQQHRFLQRVLYNSDHLLGLINDILDLSKIEAGKLDLRIEHMPLGPILEGVLATAIGLTADKQLTLTLEADAALPRVWMDKQRVRQVLLNLLSNAAKFTAQGGITVRVQATGDDFVQIAVADTGIGIPAESQALVFEEFRQVESELGRTQQGTGLGLPISKRLVELHGGRMWVESTPGVGSTFCFTLPTLPYSHDGSTLPATGSIEA